MGNTELQTPVPRGPDSQDLLFLQLARELAMGIQPINDVLNAHGVTPDRWAEISANATFQRIFGSELEAWESATNTAERVKIKALAFVEEILPEFYARANDPREPLNGKVEILKAVTKLAGIGANGIDVAGPGERLSVTINLGADQQLKIEKQLPAKVIGAEPD